MNRAPLETSLMETTVCLSECAEAVANIYKWTKTTKPPFNLNWTPMNPRLRREPKGVILMVVPFNFPLFLTVSPLVSTLLNHSAHDTEWAVSITKRSRLTHGH
jgi:aldehyde dehydrogenase (NAD+)